MSVVGIGCLRLRAAHRASVGRAAILLEDAFRTASLPGLPPGGVLLLRCLELGRLAVDCPPQTLALRIESRLRALPPLTLRAGSAEAPTAAAVCFADAIESRAALLAQGARGPLRAWYWAYLLPGAVPPALRGSLVQWLPMVLDEVAARHGIAGCGALLMRLAQVGVLETVLERLTVAPVVPGLPGGEDLGTAPVSEWQAEGPRSGPGGEAPSSADSPPLAAASAISRRRLSRQAQALLGQLPESQERLLRRWLARWGRGDARSSWLVGALLAPGRGLDFASPQGQAVVRRVLEALATPRAAPWSPGGGQTPASAAVRVPGAQSLREPVSEPSPDPSPGAVDSPDPETTPPPAGVHDDPADWRPTPYAGLLFLLPVLARLGLDRLAPEGGPGAPGDLELPLRLLRAVGERLALDPADPLWAALPQPLPDPPPPRFVAPLSWRRLLKPPGDRAELALRIHRLSGEQGRRLLTAARGRLPVAVLDRSGLGLELWRHQAPMGLGPPLPPMDPWQRLLIGLLRVLARFLGRHARTSPRRLVFRPGRVLATATHLDIRLDGRAVDLELRRAGLDLDPGWTPWLGRVVAFHYDYGPGP